MCRAMEEMRNDTEFKTRVNDAIQIMKRFNVTVQEALKVLQVPDSEYARCMAAI